MIVCVVGILLSQIELMYSYVYTCVQCMHESILNSILNHVTWNKVGGMPNSIIEENEAGY